MDMILDLSVNLNIVSLFSVTCVVGTHLNCLIEAIPMYTYNKCLSNKLFKFSTTFVSLKCVCRNEQDFV